MTSPKLSFALQMDPVAGIDITGDSTFALGLEAQSRGHNLWYYTPENLSFNVSFKSLARQALTDPNVAIQAAGIPMPAGIPAGIPAFAENIDFTQSEVEKNRMCRRALWQGTAL